MKYLILTLVLLIGCGTDNGTTIQGSYDDMCDRQPDSVMCSDNSVTGIKYDRDYYRTTALELLDNFTYQDEDIDYWTHNDMVNIPLVGDCEDISMTYISQLILDGVSPDTIYFIISGIDGKTEHAYAVIEVNDKNLTFYKNDWLEDMHYMRMDNVGKFKEIK